MGARRYSPQTARWLQPDSYYGGVDNLGLSSDLLSANRYDLAGSNPVNFVETDGHRTAPESSETCQAGTDACLARVPDYVPTPLPSAPPGPPDPRYGTDDDARQLSSADPGSSGDFTISDWQAAGTHSGCILTICLEWEILVGAAVSAPDGTPISVDVSYGHDGGVDVSGGGLLLSDRGIGVQSEWDFAYMKYQDGLRMFGGAHYDRSFAGHFERATVIQWGARGRYSGVLGPGIYRTSVDVKLPWDAPMGLPAITYKTVRTVTLAFGIRAMYGVGIKITPKLITDFRVPPPQLALPMAAVGVGAILSYYISNLIGRTAATH
jgi:RHS repeat-associated protein